MKFALSWHRESAQNFRQTLAEEEARLAYLVARVEKMRTAADFYDQQIAEAEKRGMPAFDPERLLVRKKA